MLDFQFPRNSYVSKKSQHLSDFQHTKFSVCKFCATFFLVLVATYLYATYYAYQILHTYGYTLRDKKQKHFALLQRTSKMKQELTTNRNNNDLPRARAADSVPQKGDFQKICRVYI